MIKSNLKEIRMKEYAIDSKSEFARMLEVPVQTYIKWENGESSPNLNLALTIAKKLNKTIEDIWYQ
ncbi:MAG: helix-turn-helix domain-containing protein [Clostridium sp.]|uniref:helix-turn-helix transcriptional regulator n=1 Tax=Clostridium sp. TaxID=1506 RepID=UPI0029020069|nr:helix-turn-helix domain-containing protein [Clostridium sp.]MDU1602833.1 helix-turn-helix domain-containing protein [Clostridium sp.]